MDSLRLNKLLAHGGMKIGNSEDVRLYVLNPLRAFRTGRLARNSNNQSLVLKVVYGATSLLLRSLPSCADGNQGADRGFEVVGQVIPAAWSSNADG